MIFDKISNYSLYDASIQIFVWISILSNRYFDLLICIV